MKSSRADIVDLFDYAWHRFTQRMAGLTDDELDWCPTDEERISLRWRLAHLAGVLSEERNARWLGYVDDELGEEQPESARTEWRGADEALADVKAAYDLWRGLVNGLAPAAFDQPIGTIAGRYGEATRRAFALHIVDELIHHTAEAALLRDLYAAKDATKTKGG